MDYIWITYGLHMDDYLYNQDIRQDSFFGAGMIWIQEVTLNEACSQGSKVFGPCFVSLAKASKAHGRGNIRIKYIEIISNHDIHVDIYTIIIYIIIYIDTYYTIFNIPYIMYLCIHIYIK